MLGRWMLDFWRGYVVVSLHGPHVPELINRATLQGIMLWEIRRLPNGACSLRMHRDDVRQLVTLLKQTGTKIRFERKHGVPFLIWRAWRRKFFLAGALTFCIALFALTSMIWNVEVQGDLKRLSPETIEQAASELGLHRGTWIGHLPDTDILQNQMLDKLPELSIVNVKIHGTKVSIEAVEKVALVTPAPTEPQNIVAKTTASIKQIFAHRGKPLVRTGETVHAGQVLISGSLGEGKKAVHAAGVIRGEVWYTSEISVPLETVQKTYTGNYVEKQFLTFWDYPVQIWGYGELQYELHEEESTDKELSIGDFIFPVKYRNNIYREVEMKKITLTQEQAVATGLELARADVATKMGKSGTITHQKVLHAETKGGKLEIKILNKVEEEIGVPQRFDPAPPPDPNAQPPSGAAS